MRQLAFVYLEGRGVDKNERLAFHYTARAAKLGDVGAKRNLAKMLNDGVGCERDEVRAMRLVGRLAENWDKECLDMTAQWFDHYVEAAAHHEKDQAAKTDGAKNPVPEWGEAPEPPGAEDDDVDMADIDMDGNPFFGPNRLSRANVGAMFEVHPDGAKT